MDLFNLFAKIGLDSSDYERGLSDAKKSMSDTVRFMASLGREMSDDNARAFEDMARAQNDYSESMKDFGRKMEDAGEAVNELSEEAEKASDSVQEVARETENVGQETEKHLPKAKKHWWQLGEAVDKTESKIKASTIALGNWMYEMGKAAARTLIDIPKLGLTYNMQMEDYTTNFKVMLGSMEAAEAKVKELKTMAAKTPFAMSDLAEATKELLNFGVSSDKTTSIMTRLGDISLGNAQRFNGLATAYGKIHSSGVLMRDDIESLITNGFNPMLYITQETGESMTELYQRMSEGRVSIDELDIAIRRATSEGGQFYRGMEEGAKTLSAQLGTLEEGWSALLGEAMSPVNEQLSGKTLPAAIEALDKLSEALFGVGEDAETAKSKLFIDSEGNEQDPSKNLLTWVSDLMAEWTNGVVEDKATVEQYVTAFNENTNMIKDALWKRINDTSNPMTEEEIEAAKAKISDIESMQREVDELLNKRQGSYITPEEEARMRAILTTLETMQTELEAAEGFEENIVSPWERMVSAAGDASTDFITKLGDFFIWCASDDGENMNKVLDGALISLAAIQGLKYGGLLGALAGGSIVAVVRNLDKIGAAADKAANKLVNFLDKLAQAMGVESTTSREEGYEDGYGELWDIDDQGRPYRLEGGKGRVGFATGLDYVPYNEFPALLHEGEAVLTKLEAQQWRSGNTQTQQPAALDPNQLAAAIVSAFANSGIGFSVGGRELATVTASANTRALNARRNDINIGKVRF